MQAIKVNGTSHLRTNHARDDGFAEKCTDSKLYFPARHLCSFLRQPVLLSPQPRSHIVQKTTECWGKEPMQRHCCVLSTEELNALRQSPDALRGSPENQRHQQWHSQCLRLSRSLGIASKQFIFCKMKQFLTKEGKPEQPIFLLLSCTIGFLICLTYRSSREVIFCFFF